MPRKPPPPNDLERLVAKGLEFFAENNFEMALKYIDDALELDPKDQTAVFTKGRILMKSGKYKEGTKYYNKLVDLGRESLKNAQRCTPEAELYENYGQPEPDEGLNYPSGGAIDSGFLENDLKANALDLKNIDEPDEDLNYEKVITLCDELLCKEPDNIEALINKSMALGLNAQYELAINCCNQILDLESNNFKSLKNKALFLEHMHRYEEAIECYEKALIINPGNIECLFGKGLTLNRLGKYDDAVLYFDKVINLNPSNEAALINKGISLGRLGKHNEAMDCYNNIIEFQRNRANNNLSTSDHETKPEPDDSVKVQASLENPENLFTNPNIDSTLVQELLDPTEDMAISRPTSLAVEEPFETSKVVGDLQYEPTGDGFQSYPDVKDLREHEREITDVITLLRKQHGGSFYYVIETVKLFKVSIIILKTLLQDYEMDGIVVCLDKPPRYYQKILNKKCDNSSRISYIDTLSNLVTDYIQPESSEGGVDHLKGPEVFHLNSKDLNLDGLVELIEVSMQKIVEKYGGEDHFVFFDNIAGLQPFYSTQKIKKFSNKFGARLKELNLYGIIMAPKETIKVKLSDIIKSIPSVITSRLKSN